MVSRGRNAHRDEFFLVRKVENTTASRRYGLYRSIFRWMAATSCFQFWIFADCERSRGRPHTTLRQDQMPFHSRDELEPPPLGEDADVKYRNTQ